ncbi:hypothetical protein ACFQ1S_27300 [Kibdelosporangium lantanae]|uniref:Branched-chain amino acid ABC transporter permease n=1 Tax=Kibdelosporangium lantanae TaxID=1497396 RepID=A0ABW3MH67_9PSEU
MDQLLLVLVSGIASGAIYGLMGLGLVIVYRATDVVNFALASLATLGLYAAITFHVDAYCPCIPSRAGVTGMVVPVRITVIAHSRSLNTHVNASAARAATWWVAVAGVVAAAHRWWVRSVIGCTLPEAQPSDVRATVRCHGVGLARRKTGETPTR